MIRDTVVVSVRLGPDEGAALASLAQERSCSKSEALRLALVAGIPLARRGVMLNLPRIALLEYIQAGIDVIMIRDHADYADQLETIALRRVEEFMRSDDIRFNGQNVTLRHTSARGRITADRGIAVIRPLEQQLSPSRFPTT